MSFLDVFNDRIGMLQTGLDEMDSNDVKLEATDETDKSLEGTDLMNQAYYRILLHVLRRDTPPGTD